MKTWVYIYPNHELFAFKDKKWEVFNSTSLSDLGWVWVSELPYIYSNEQNVWYFLRESIDKMNYFYHSEYGEFYLFNTWENKYKDWLKNPQLYGGEKVLQRINKAYHDNDSFLDLSDSNISNIEPLSNLVNIKSIIFDKNSITDLSPIYKSKNLESLILTANPISDVEKENLEESLHDTFILWSNNYYRFYEDTKSNFILENNNSSSTNDSFQLFPPTLNDNEILYNWRIIKSFPDSDIIIQRRGFNDKFTKLDNQLIPQDSYIKSIFGNSSCTYVLVYDVKRNIPSGRNLIVSEPGYDLYKIFNKKSPQIKLVKKGIDVGGIDTSVYCKTLPDKIILAGTNRIISIYDNSDTLLWDVDVLINHEIIELIFQGNKAYALIKEIHSGYESNFFQDGSTFKLAKLGQDSSIILENNINSENGIPYNIKIIDDNITWDIANNKSSFTNLLRFDLNRMHNNGWMEFGSNNYEGRVAWLQTYYLNSLLWLLESDSHGEKIITEDFKNILHYTLRDEIKYLCLICLSDSPSLFSKRYSFNREPILFALHIARISTILKSSLGIFDDNVISESLLKLNNELHYLDNTVEQLVEEDSLLTLAYKKGSPFWADGVNVPYNYISGYVEGLLLSSSSQSFLSLSEQLLQPIKTEIENSSNVWTYWGGVGNRGWSINEHISVNTPAWHGSNDKVAHITYRTMDAKSLLQLYKITKNKDLLVVVDKIKNLVQEGLLLPELNQILVDLNLEVKLPKVVGKYYSRPTSPWQISSQIWALISLSDSF